MVSLDLKWSGDLRDNLRGENGKIKSRIGAVMAYNAPKIEADMKIHAPWTDRTGNARNTLSAVYHKIDKNEVFRITISGAMPYQIWLETRHSGKYAILRPSLIKWSPKVMEMVSKAIFK